MYTTHVVGSQHSDVSILCQASCPASHRASESVGSKPNSCALVFAGQLGDDTPINRDTPVTVAQLTNVTSIAAGEHHSCAVLQDGTARCWGRNTNGEPYSGREQQPLVGGV